MDCFLTCNPLVLKLTLVLNPTQLLVHRQCYMKSVPQPDQRSASLVAQLAVTRSRRRLRTGRLLLLCGNDLGCRTHPDVE